MVFFMQLKDRYRKMLFDEIRDFPEDRLHILLKLVKFARKELLADEIKEEEIPEDLSLEAMAGSFKGYLSSSENFIKRKKDEKALDLKGKLYGYKF